jgi:hypothetical protein
MAMRARWRAAAATLRRAGLPRGGGGRPAAHGAREAMIASAVLGMLLSAALVWGASDAAFKGSTQNGAGNWSAGTVVLGDDDSNGVMFNLSGIQPGDTGQRCITVTYTGTLPTAGARLYVGALTGTLGPYVTATVEQGTGGSFGSCAGFAMETTTTATLSSLAGTYTSFGTGFGTWAPTGSGQSRTYRISWNLAWDNNAANRTAGLTLTWEAQNS